MTLETTQTYEADKKEKRIFTDEVFTKLINAQKEIQNETDVTPTLRKLTNAIMTDENINNAKRQLTELYS